jgi:ubiquinone/menaquinone biosynthesis C-methylase UbiE
MAQGEQWQLSDDAAALYERYLVPTMFGPWATDLVALAALREGDRVLDVACGTGIVARNAAQQVGRTGRVVGLDMNAGMLAMARSAAASAGLDIEWCESSALSMPFEDGSFDVVLCQQGLQFFPDRLAGLREMHRVLTDGGRLVVTCWQSIENRPEMTALAAALERHIGPGASATNRAPMSLGDADELRGLIADAGFRDVTITPAERLVHYASVEDYLSIRTRTTPSSDPLKQADEQTYRAVLRDLNEAFTPYVTANGLDFPTRTNHATARR